ncbi:unnamed protein product, partial [Rangifer tarandus platyrhynchus]
SAATKAPGGGMTAFPRPARSPTSGRGPRLEPRSRSKWSQDKETQGRVGGVLFLSLSASGTVKHIVCVC